MSGFYEFMSTIPTPFNMIVLVMLIVFTAGAITSVATQIRKFMCHREEMELKRAMVDRGLSADEIERVIQVGAHGNRTAGSE